MKTIILSTSLYTVFCLFFCLSSVLAEQHVVTAASLENQQRNLQVNTERDGSVVQEVSSLQDEMIGHIDWDNGYVYAVGDGVPPRDAINPAQARIRAKRAAIDTAMARLLETIQEVRVDTESTTRNFVNENNLVNTRISGIVKNAEIVELRQAEDGSYQVKLRMPINGKKGISSILLPLEMTRIKKVLITTRVTQPDDKATDGESGMADVLSSTTIKIIPDKSPGRKNSSEDNPVKKDTFYSGLIVNAKGLGLSPALFPTIKTESGKILYDLSAADPNATVEDGLCSYKKSVTAATNDPRIGSNPIVIKALGVSGESGVDMIVTDEDAKRVLAANKKASFLRQARVIIVID